MKMSMLALAIVAGNLALAQETPTVPSENAPGTTTHVATPAAAPAATPAPSAEVGAVKVAVIVNPKNKVDKLTEGKARNFYLKMASRWPSGEEVLPAACSTDTPAQKLFYRKVLSWTPEEVERYWVERQYQVADARPAVFDTDAGVIEYVFTHPGAIGCVNSASITPELAPKVKVVMELSE